MHIATSNHLIDQNAAAFDLLSRSPRSAGSRAALLNELRSLAAMASGDPEICFQVGPTGTNWCYRPSESLILMPAEDLLDKPGDFCRGILMHEIGHAKITRAQDMISNKIKNNPVFADLINVIEDCRLETWLPTRFAGCADWIRYYNNRLCSEMVGRGMIECKVRGFFLGVLYWWWTGVIPTWIPVESADLLVGLRGPLKRAIQRIPRNHPDPAKTALVYEQHEASRFYLRLDGASAPSPFEMEVRMCQMEVLEIIRRKIRPELTRMMKAEEVTDYDGAADGDEPLTLVSPALSPGGQWKQCDQTSKTDAEIAWAVGDHGLSRDEIWSAERVVETYKTQIDELLALLRESFRAGVGDHWRKHLEVGPRLSMSAVMAAEANPRLNRQRIWKSRDIPDLPELDLTLCIDRSGSMEGGKAYASFEAAVILAEAAARLGCGLAVTVFDRDAETIKGSSTPEIGIGLRRALENPRGGTSIHAALEHVRDELLPSASSRNTLVCLISDGLSSIDEARRLVLELEAEGVVLAALGLGSNTAGLQRIVNRAQTGLDASDLVPALAEILSDFFVQIGARYHTGR